MIWLVRRMPLVLVLATAACGASRPSPELAAARQTYERAASGPTKESNPAGLYEARRALESAERLERDDPGSEDARSLAYIAERKAVLAEVNGRAAVARAKSADAEKASMLAATPPVSPQAKPDRGARATDDCRCGQLGRGHACPPVADGVSRPEKAAKAQSVPAPCPEERRLPRKESP